MYYRCEAHVSLILVVAAVVAAAVTHESSVGVHHGRSRFMNSGSSVRVQLLFDVYRKNTVSVARSLLLTPRTMIPSLPFAACAKTRTTTTRTKRRTLRVVTSRPRREVETARELLRARRY